MKYYLTYDITVHKNGIEKEDLPEGCGACDAVFLATVLEEDNGSFSYAMQGVDGRSGGNKMQPLQLFQVWVKFAEYLSGALEKDSGFQLLTKEVVDVVERARKG